MTRSDSARIDDIMRAAELVSRIVQEGRLAFDDDWKSLPVAERMITVIGEAASRLSAATTSARPAAKVSTGSQQPLLTKPPMETPTDRNPLGAAASCGYPTLRTAI